MRHLFNYSNLLICMIAVTIMGCEAAKDKNDECDATKMIEPQSPKIYLKLLLECDTLPGLDHYLYLASRATFSGSITKIYCDGTVSGRFEFSPTYFLKEMDPQNLYEGFYLNQPYIFTFANDKDYVLVQARLKAYFADGQIYESDELLRRFYYKDIKYDVIEMIKYIRLLMPDPTTWTEMYSY